MLIDVSGSMKKNDPHNIRVPALKLLVNLLPPDSRAGLWLFAGETTPLVDGTRVDDAWKQNALRQAAKVHSRGMYTHVEDALLQATADWKAPLSQARRSVILLTDGVVDVSSDPQQSKASRDRIINRIIPALQQNSVQVHTIALSANADHELLKKIAFDTGGWNKSVDSAGELQRVFLKMFKKAVPRDNVPLVDNAFSIDAGIDEFSVLVFRKSGAPPTRLIDPAGSEYTSAAAGANIRWQSEGDYDLVTVMDPPEGRWKLDAEVDPDNQVMVVTDLKLILDELPNYVSEKEPLNISVSIADNGKRISRMDFLKLVEVGITQTDELDRTREWKIPHADESSGRYVQAVGETLSPGRQHFRIVANGKTFTREVGYSVDVVENPVSMEARMDADGEVLVVELRADGDVLDPRSLEAVARIVAADGSTVETEFADAAGAIQAVVEISPDASRSIVNFEVAARTVRGNPVNPKVRPLIIDEQYLQELRGVGPESGGMDDELDDELDDGIEAVEEPDWNRTAIIAVAINLVLIVGGIFTVRYFRNRSRSEQQRLIDRLAT